MAIKILEDDSASQLDPLSWASFRHQMSETSEIIVSTSSASYHYCKQVAQLQRQDVSKGDQNKPDFKAYSIQFITIYAILSPGSTIYRIA